MDPFTLALLGQGIGQAAGGIAGLFGKHGKTKNPSDVANNYLDQIPGQTKPYYQPYIDRGRTSGDTLNKQYSDMTSNPTEFYNKLGAGYKESPGYQKRLQAAMTAGNNAYAAGGLAGTPGHADYNAEKTMDLQGKDYEDYLNHVMGIFTQGQHGQQTEEEQGFNASKDYATQLGDILGQKARYGYEGQAGINEQNTQNKSNIFSGLGTLGAGVGSHFFGGGNTVGQHNKPYGEGKGVYPSGGSWFGGY